MWVTSSIKKNQAKGRTLSWPLDWKNSAGELQWCVAKFVLSIMIGGNGLVEFLGSL